MKNRVDIGKLIDKKYSNGELTLRQFNNIIDSVLKESITGYEYKRESDPGFLGENPADPGNARDIANRKNGNIIDPSNPSVGAPRHERPDEPGYGDNVEVMPQSVPDKLAEEDNLTEDTGLSTEVTPQFELPDLTSMITNTEMKVGNSDRDLINDIVANMGAQTVSDWTDRIRLLRNYTSIFSKARKVNEQNIYSAVSSLMILNVFKKLSFFTAQPGKQFEYLMAPLIAPDAAVVGANDNKIYDVESALAGKFSIKFFTAESSAVEGSYNNLSDISQTNTNGVKVVIGRVKDRHVGFGEMFLTTNLNWLKANNYNIVYGDKDRSVVYFQTSQGGRSVPTIAVYVKDKNETSNKVDSMAFGQASPLAVPPSKPRAKKTPVPTVDLIKFGGYEVKNEVLKDILEKLYNAYKTSKTTRTNNIIIKNIEDSIVSKFPELQLQSLLNDIKNIKDHNTQKAKIGQFIEILEKERYDSYLEAQKELVDKIAAQQQKAEREVAKQTSLEESASAPKKPTAFHFKFEMTDQLWALIEQKNLTFNLGSPEEYNKQMLDISEQVNGHLSRISIIFKKSKELSDNITRYFATAKEAQEKARSKEKVSDARGYGTRSIDNAKQISFEMEEVIKTRGFD
jgi:hypothetical protein